MSRPVDGHDCFDHPEYRECYFAENLDPDVNGTIYRWREEVALTPIRCG